MTGVPEKTVIYQYPSDQLYHAYWKAVGETPLPYPPSTVSETMVMLADHLGFKTHYLCGMDFSWEETRYTYRSPGSFQSHLDNTEVRFKVRNSEKTSFETETNYYHAARFLEFLSERMKSNGSEVLRHSDLLSIPNTKRFELEDLLKIPRQPTHSLPSLGATDPENVDQAKALLIAAADATKGLCLWHHLVFPPLRSRCLSLIH